MPQSPLSPSSDKLPDFDDLPKMDGMPQGCAWGIFDKGGKKDILGSINILTPEVVKGALAEAKDGVSVSLKFAAPFCSLLKCYQSDNSPVGQ
jgi:hypothetical protein